MRTTKKKYLSHLPIEENIYKADFQILDKYQMVSAEILRLALIGIAVYGFLITNVIFKVGEETIATVLQAFINKKHIFVAGAILLLLSAACALAHRYFSTDSLSHHIRGLRLRAKLMELQAEMDKRNTVKEPNKNEYQKRDLQLLSTEKLKEDEMLYWVKEITEDMKIENESLKFDFRICFYLFVTAAVFLVTGVAFVVYGFIDFISVIKL